MRVTATAAASVHFQPELLTAVLHTLDSTDYTRRPDPASSGRTNQPRRRLTHGRVGVVGPARAILPTPLVGATCSAGTSSRLPTMDRMRSGCCSMRRSG